MVFRLYWKQAGDRQNMIIRQLNIKNSGEIHDKTLEFSPGINVLYGENESERAIVHTYIKNMFLGDISEAIYDNAVFAAKLKSPTGSGSGAAKIYDRLSGNCRQLHGSGTGHADAQDVQKGLSGPGRQKTERDRTGEAETSDQDG